MIREMIIKEYAKGGFKMDVYVTGGYGHGLIHKVEAERMSEKSIWIDGNRYNRRSSYKRYWDTWDKANQHLLDKAKRDVDSAKRNLEICNSSFENIKGLKQLKELSLAEK